MSLDRKLQYQILEYLSPHYAKGFPPIDKQDFAKHPHYDTNLKYLYEYKLIGGNESKVLGSSSFSLSRIHITNRGLDFLADDGGIGAILSTVTIKFDTENIRSLIENKIISSGLPEPERKSLVEKLKSFSGEALKHLALKILEKGTEPVNDFETVTLTI